MRKRKQEPQPDPEWDGIVRWNDAVRFEQHVYGRDREFMGLSSLVWEMTEPSFKPEIGAEVTMRLVEIHRETVER